MRSGTKISTHGDPLRCLLSRFADMRESSAQMRKIASEQEHDRSVQQRKTSRVWPLLSKVSKLKVSNRRNKREVRQPTETEGRGGAQGRASSLGEEHCHTHSQQKVVSSLTHKRSRTLTYFKQPTVAHCFQSGGKPLSNLLQRQCRPIQMRRVGQNSIKSAKYYISWNI